MTDTTQKPITFSSKDQKDWVEHSLEFEHELERVDGDAGREYVPMDVFVNPRTMKEHFQYSSIRARWLRIHKAAA